MRVQVKKKIYVSQQVKCDGRTIYYGPLNRIANRDPGGFDEETGRS